MLFGGDYLGGKHYQKAMLQAHPRGWAGGIFLTTFGNAHKTVEAMAASTKFSEIVIHLAPFDKDHTYPIKKLLPDLIKWAKQMEALAVKYRGTIFMLSPFCEHNHKAKNMKPVFAKLAAAAPSCLYVNSIVNGQEVPGTITEVHIPHSKALPRIPKNPFTVSADGFGGDKNHPGDFPDTDIPKLLRHYSKARHFRWWNFRCNGKFGHLDPAPIDKRKNWPSVPYLMGHHASMKLEREGSLTYKKDRLLKSFADDHGGSGGKDNHLMAILPINSKTVSVFDTDAKVIDVMSDRGLPPHTGTPKGKRFYSSRYAYQVADIAEQNTGSRLIKVGDSPYTDGDLRSGLFR